MSNNFNFFSTPISDSLQRSLNSGRRRQSKDPEFIMKSIVKDVVDKLVKTVVERENYQASDSFASQIISPDEVDPEVASPDAPIAPTFIPAHLQLLMSSGESSDDDDGEVGVPEPTRIAPRALEIEIPDNSGLQIIHPEVLTPVAPMSIPARLQLLFPSGEPSGAGAPGVHVRSWNAPKPTKVIPEIEVITLGDSDEEVITLSSDSDAPTAFYDSPDDDTPAPSNRSFGIRSGPPPKRPKWSEPLSLQDQLTDASFDTPPVTPPPSMVMQMDKNSFEYCIWMCEYMKRNLKSYQISNLKSDAIARNCLYKNYVDLELLKKSNGNGKGLKEQLPIYIFLMAPKTQKTYLEGFKNEQIPHGDDFHVHVFKASMKSDEETKQLLEDHYEFKKSADWLTRCVKAIKKGKDWRVNTDVMGVVKVDSLDEIPDGSCLACYKETPNFATIESKSLNCIVINPSPESAVIIDPHQKQDSLAINGWAIGRHHKSYSCKCIGPNIHENILEPTGNRTTCNSLASLFSNALYGNSKKKMRLPIYAVDGFI